MAKPKRAVIFLKTPEDQKQYDLIRGFIISRGGNFSQHMLDYIYDFNVKNYLNTRNVKPK